jgi:hypothetical protein
MPIFENIDGGLYPDYTERWYGDLGVTIMTGLIFNACIPLITFFVEYLFGRCIPRTIDKIKATCAK